MVLPVTLTKGGTFTYDIRVKDFVLARPDLRGERFHISSINPPYFKINAKTSPYAEATGDLYKGNPNIYASFMAIVGACLEPGGQMVAIVPRSFANGLYFRGFRHYLLKTLSLDRIYIFKARNKVFKEQSVLQENVICSFSKNNQIEEITIRTSEGHVDLVDASQEMYASELIIDKKGGHEIIRIPESAEEAQILKAVESWPSSFTSNGYFISTGPVVEHRTREYISRYEKGMNAVPLIRMHNVKPFQTKWSPDGVKNACFLLHNGYNKHVSSNSPYVLLKRFSSKDEKRRLVAGVHNPSMWDGDLIALENHLNYIGIKEETFELKEAFGLAALFNSTFIDKYFRCISGNTQVNATEMRMLKLPTHDVIKMIGSEILNQEDFSQEAIDECVNRYLQEM